MSSNKLRALTLALVLAVGVLFAVGSLPADAAVGFVQTGTANGTVTQTPHITYGSTPTSGNLLVVSIGWYTNNGATTVTFTCPTNWTCLDNVSSTGTNSTKFPTGMVTMYCVVTGSVCNTTTITWTTALSASSAYGCHGVEVSGQAASSFIDGHTMQQIAVGTSATLQPGPLTPSLAGSFSFTQADVFAGTAPTTPTSYTGFGGGTNGGGTGEAFKGAYLNPVSSSQQPSWGTQVGSASLVIIKPVAVKSNLMMNGCCR